MFNLSQKSPISLILACLILGSVTLKKD
jgi:hypothetical protein